MPAIALIAVGALDEYGRVGQTLGKHLSTDVIQTDTFADVSSRLFHGCIAVHVGEQSQTKSLAVARV